MSSESQVAPELVLVEDEGNLRELYADLLQSRGLTVHGFETIAEATNHLSQRAPDVLVLDVKLPDGDGLALLQRLREEGFRVPTIVTTAFGTMDRAVHALRMGAVDFLVKPFPNERLVAAVHAALEAGRRDTEIELSAATVEAKADAPDGLVGADGGLKDVVEVLPRIAGSEATVLILGESGTGKELIAKAIHAASPRLDGPFVAVNCAALPPSLLESELFGFERGAFTGAHARRLGLIETAAGGTLLLDEIGDLPLEAQGRLLRVLQEKEILRIGGRTPVPVDVRILGATHRDLASLSRDGGFREDLYHRLSVVEVHLPSLRERPQDVPGLLAHFLTKHAQRHGKPPPHPEPSVVEEATRHDWPGNVRQLENVCERAVIFGRFELPAEPTSTPTTAGPAPAPPVEKVEVKPLRAAVAEAERAAVVAALQASGGNKAEAARLLGISYKTLFNKLHEHDVKLDLVIG